MTSKQLLLERMNIIGGMPLREMDDNLPPGISSNDFEDLDTFVNKELHEDDDLGAKSKTIGRDKLDQMLKSRLGKEKRKLDDPIVHASTVKKIVDKNGNAFDQNKLKQLITVRPKEILGQNAKMKKTGFYNISIPAFKGLFYDEQEDKFKIVNTCGKAGDCAVYCYAMQGGNVMWEAASLNKTRNLNYLLNYWKEWKSQLLNEIKGKELLNDEIGVPTVIRWHDSGDFLSEKYLAMAMDIARETPDVKHYAYTKEYELTKGANKPENFIFTHSFGGQSDKFIDPTADKHAQVVPRNLFKGLLSKNKETEVWDYLYDGAKDEFKQKLATQYNIDKNNILTFKEMIKIPESNEMKWHVIVTPSNADTAAIRKDVLGIYLLEH
jgi:hypothetical protein